MPFVQRRTLGAIDSARFNPVHATAELPEPLSVVGLGGGLGVSGRIRRSALGHGRIPGELDGRGRVSSSSVDRGVAGQLARLALGQSAANQVRRGGGEGAQQVADRLENELQAQGRVAIHADLDQAAAVGGESGRDGGGVSGACSRGAWGPGGGEGLRVGSRGLGRGRDARRRRDGDGIGLRYEWRHGAGGGRGYLRSGQHEEGDEEERPEGVHCWRV